jgi:hypothetical protein
LKSTGVPWLKLPERSRLAPSTVAAISCVEYRWVTDRYDALPTMAADLVQRQVRALGLKLSVLSAVTESDFDRRPDDAALRD